ncbi:pyruvate phosphate dikinase PEP/pyruvate-binding protein [Desulfovibrio sp. X2]|uniref:PEP/pyruvate-binding domain-containing protein n=1 Tax=Desulfovibrio sp. X2 TaxID=941449 RepID=UPI00035887DA|nr:PEP/pyruvate-binding domain-containing protein [Desulfovibrio sp. X2]EPR43386.1 pyruvate phosphate dikinase PEP/pyruvate-binding protein [Desulfovibrio sp. X2]
MQLPRLFRFWAERIFAPETALKRKYDAFRALLSHDKRALECITEIEEILYGQIPADWARASALFRALSWSLSRLVDSLCAMNPADYGELPGRLDELLAEVGAAFAEPARESGPPYVLSLAEAAARPELCGGKAAGLGAAAALGLPVPEGFALTTHAYELFLSRAGLRARLDETLSRVRVDEPEDFDELCAMMQEAVEDAALPVEVAEELGTAVAGLAQKGVTLFAVRSSAVGEDGRLSYAGLYDSRLFVPASEVPAAVRDVYLSKYSPRAVAYRVRYGIPDDEAPMAVAVVRMLDPAASGVIYTDDAPPAQNNKAAPDGDEPCPEHHMAVYAVSGAGEKLVDGSVVPLTWRLAREDGRVVEGPAPDAQRAAPAPLAAHLTPGRLHELWRHGMALERGLGGPQDVEWCLDASDGLYVVQSRPFQHEEPATCDPAAEVCEDIANPRLIDGAASASGGVAVGRVFFPGRITDGRDIPSGSVVICRTLSPKLASALGRLTAVISPAGSRAGHFASVAREFGVPVLVGAPSAMQVLRPGQVVTVDADSGVVYDGVAEPLRRLAGRERKRPPSRLRERLSPVLHALSRLTLTDPGSPDFTPRGCASLHDVVRFCHEKGVAEMFSLGGKGRGLGQARPLETDLPLSFYVLDLDGGVDPELAGESVPPGALRSAPMRALWDGLTAPEISWHEGLRHLDWERFDRISGGILSLADKSLSSYALLSADYCHAMIRFGYHFATVDALCGPHPEANYASLRFKGGGADFDRRLLRLEYLREVLTRVGFEARTKGDMIDARLSRRPEAETREALRLLGLLLGQTRLMDMALSDSAQALHMAEDFLARHAPSLSLSRGDVL